MGKVKQEIKIPVFHMRRTHSGHCVGDFGCGLTWLELYGIMKKRETGSKWFANRDHGGEK